MGDMGVFDNRRAPVRSFCFLLVQGGDLQNGCEFKGKTAVPRDWRFVPFFVFLWLERIAVPVTGHGGRGYGVL
jgi:hypothetical protein